LRYNLIKPNGQIIKGRTNVARKTAEESERTRQQILSAAKELFIRKGYSATSMEDIRSHANVSKGSIYYHFRSKQQLFLEIMEQHMVEWMDGWQRRVKPDMTAVEKLYALAAYWVDEFDDPLLKVADEFIANHGTEPGMMEKLVALVGLQSPPIRAVMEEGIASGAFRRDDPETLTHIFVGLMGGLGVTYYEAISLERRQAMYRKAVDVFLHGIGAK